MRPICPSTSYSGTNQYKGQVSLRAISALLFKQLIHLIFKSLWILQDQDLNYD